MKGTLVILTPHFSQIIDVALVAGELGVLVGSALVGFREEQSPEEPAAGAEVVRDDGPKQLLDERSKEKK